MQSTSATRLCNSCGLDRPLTAFRLRRKGGQARHSQCNDCRRAADALRATRRQSQTFEAAINFAARQPTYGRAAVAIETMIHRMGGLRQFCDRWHSELHAVMSKRPGSRLASRSFTLIGQLIAHNAAREAALEKEAAAKREYELHQMSDEELAAKLTAGVVEMAESLLASEGWRRVEPEGE